MKFNIEDTLKIQIDTLILFTILLITGIFLYFVWEMKHSEHKYYNYVRRFFIIFNGFCLYAVLDLKGIW